MKIIESGQTLGARVEGLDLAQPLTDEQFHQLVRRWAAMAC